MKTFHYLPLAALLPVLAVQASEIAPGDYEMFPVGATIGMIYYQHATTDSRYARGHKVNSDFKLTSDISILRLLHVVELTDRLTVDPQFLLPFGRVDSGASTSVLGDASGVGDLILAPAFKYRLNDANDVLAFTPYLFVPTGSWDKDDALNIGENRWKLDLQAGYVKHIGEKWALDLAGDAILFGDNDNFGAGSVRREQKVSYEGQIMGRYMPTTATTFAVGVGHRRGGESRIDDVSQDDELRTTNFRISATTFVTPKDQFQLQLGKDISVENGPREDFRVNLRYAHIF
ncbi:hypothetical protein ALO71_02946 [Pseudomonas amygdali pv. dendropanacis]|uniref:Protein involved in meta-pathway of phenol degradation n=1 Tax=Pseudomonas amygdali pv. dendropanacis TaxID=235272 RepID=A0A0P9QGD3_PSEA0|nr:transporter [Pseudomonas amygdali]KPX23596.1 hypothetical protein ALO71_02946 [Pseudomonas amygdali pv. dendropanacis]KWS81250.1 phenol degradation protein meta [Pseudomonas amygdali pv. dendropanacis]